MNKEKVMANLTANGFEPIWFDTAADAAKYLNGALKGRKIVFGGSVTLEGMGLFESLSENNEVYWHWRDRTPGARKKAEEEADVYMCSANGLSESGCIVNIDNSGNRVANAVCGHDLVIYVVGKNKIVPTVEDAIARARNVAAPKNVKRFNRANPCTVGEEECHDCDSPDRLCRVMSVLWRKTALVKTVQVILIGEDMGY